MSFDPEALLETLRPPSHRAARALVVGEHASNARAQLALAACAVPARLVCTGIRPLTALPERLVLDQIDRAGAVDVILLGDGSGERHVFTLADKLGVRPEPRVVDPDLVDADGQARHGSNHLEGIRVYLLRHATVAVMNARELTLLTGREVHDVEGLREAAKRVHDFGAKTVVAAGGRMEGHAVDLVYDGHAFTEFGHDRVRKPQRTHGQGILFAAFIAAHLARGAPTLRAVEVAKRQVTRAIEGALEIDGRWQADPLAHAHEQLGVSREPLEREDDR